MNEYEINELSEAQAYDNDVELSDAEVLMRTKAVKLRLLEQMTGPNMSTDPKEVASLMKVADSLDKTALTKLRLNNEQNSNQNVTDALGIIAAMQSQVGNTDPFMVNVIPDGEPREVVIENTLVEMSLVEGELSHESRDLQYDDFVNKFEANPPKK